MQTQILLLEISDKIVPVQAMYVLFTTLGGVGLLLGFWRWWLSAIWFVFPVSLFAIAFIWLQIEEINYFYKHIIRELGESYIWHNYISVALGISLNLAGIFIKFFKPKKLVLQ